MSISGVSLEHAPPPFESLGVKVEVKVKDDGRGWVYDKKKVEWGEECARSARRKFGVKSAREARGENLS